MRRLNFTEQGAHGEAFTLDVLNSDWRVSLSVGYVEARSVITHELAKYLFEAAEAKRLFSMVAGVEFRLRDLLICDLQTATSGEAMRLAAWRNDGTPRRDWSEYAQTGPVRLSCRWQAQKFVAPVLRVPLTYPLTPPELQAPRALPSKGRK